jgi:hypothetical protein
MDTPAVHAPRPRPLLITLLRSLPPWLLRLLIPVLIACIRLQLVLTQMHVLFLRLLLSFYSTVRSFSAAVHAFAHAERGAWRVVVFEVVVCGVTVQGTYVLALVALKMVRRGMLYCAGVWEVESVSSDVGW